MSKDSNPSFEGATTEEHRTVRGYTTELDREKQAKHSPSSPRYKPGGSPITISMDRLQDLVDQKAGTGHSPVHHKEIVDFGEIIGTYVDRIGERSSTTRGTIHYSKTGAHVVPARPFDQLDEKGQ